MASQRVACCINKYLGELLNDTEEINLHDHCCSGQHGNIHVAVIFLLEIKEFYSKNSAVINYNILDSEYTHLEADIVYALIEKTRTDTTAKVVLPEDWPNLVTRIEREAAINVIKMEQKVFLNFISLVKRVYIYRKTNAEEKPVSWQKIKCFKL